MSSETLRTAVDKASDMMNEVSEKAGDALNKAGDIGGDAIEDGYEAVREYANKGLDYVGEQTDRVSGFVRRAPWFAVIGAFAVGYVTARFLRRMR